MNSRFIARAALYAALYAALVLAPGLNAIAYGPVQFRLAEALTVFACFDPAAIPGLTLGTALGNLGSPLFIVDVAAGSLLTLITVWLMRCIGPRYWALLVPVAVNGVGIAVLLALVLHLPLWASAVWIAAGEAAVMVTAGAVLLTVIRRRGHLFGVMNPRSEGCTAPRTRLRRSL